MQLGPQEQECAQPALLASLLRFYAYAGAAEKGGGRGARARRRPSHASRPFLLATTPKQSKTVNSLMPLLVCSCTLLAEARKRQQATAPWQPAAAAPSKQALILAMHQRLSRVAKLADVLLLSHLACLAQRSTQQFANSIAGSAGAPAACRLAATLELAGPTGEDLDGHGGSFVRQEHSWRLVCMLGWWHANN